MGWIRRCFRNINNKTKIYTSEMGESLEFTASCPTNHWFFPRSHLICHESIAIRLKELKCFLGWGLLSVLYLESDISWHISWSWNLNECIFIYVCFETTFSSDINWNFDRYIAEGETAFLHSSMHLQNSYEPASLNPKLDKQMLAPFRYNVIDIAPKNSLTSI